jgi:DNA-binding LacI/PurR family transcriptional regulator
MAKVSQKDIARALNIARVTVTKALQGHPDIAKSTVIKVREKAREMGYIPNFIGRALSTSKTQLIGILLPRIDHSFYAYALQYFSNLVNHNGYELIPFISFEDSTRERKKIEMLMSLNIDGLVIIPSFGNIFQDIYDRIRGSGIPTVYFERTPEHFEGYSITCDEKSVSKKAILYAIDRGYTKILHFAGPHWLNVGDQKLRGYLEALNTHNIPPREEYIFQAGSSIEDGHQAFMQLYRKKIRPELIFCWNDLVAHGVYRAARELRLNIPEDLAVIGFGDIDKSRLLTPPLTSISLPLKSMAIAASHMLFDLINGKTVRNEQYDGIFKIRKSMR